MLRKYLARNRIPRFARKNDPNMFARFVSEPKYGGLYKNKYFYLYHLLMFFCALYVRMSYFYFKHVLHVYAGLLFAVSGIVCHQWRWNANLTWFYYFFIVLMQLMFEHLNLHLPAWFVLYPTIPMIIASMLENLMLHLSIDPDIYRIHEEIMQRHNRSFQEAALTAPDGTTETRTLAMKWKMIFVDIYFDLDLRYYYPIIFEAYMTTCALFCIKGGGVMHIHCFGEVYMVALWIVFVYTEFRKRENRPKMFMLPNPIVKVILLLYAPPPFWTNISALSFINIWMGPDKDEFVLKLTASAGLLLVTIAANTFARDVVFGDCPFIEF